MHQDWTFSQSSNKVESKVPLIFSSPLTSAWWKSSLCGFFSQDQLWTAFINSNYWWKMFRVSMEKRWKRLPTTRLTVQGFMKITISRNLMFQHFYSFQAPHVYLFPISYSELIHLPGQLSKTSPNSYHCRKTRATKMQILPRLLKEPKEIESLSASKSIAKPKKR